MEKIDLEKATPGPEESSMLTRNRSFKSKQLVRSQAIRETHSPPRTSSPAFVDKNVKNECVNDKREDEPIDAALCDKNYIDTGERTIDGSNNSSQGELCDGGSCVMSDSDKKQQTVEIQITPGATGCWDLESQMDQRMRTKRWLFHKNNSDSSRDLLSNNPRIICVCGYCAACPHCRGRKRRKPCPIKQDSGIACSDDCPDCLDNQQSALYDALEKSGSLDAEDQAYYCKCPERKEKPKNVSLTRSDSDDKSEPTGMDLVDFIKETLNKNPRDRMTLLKIEKELTNFVIDNGRCVVRFPVMTSYGRMLVHRCASLYQLSHHLDQTNKTCVLVSKSGTSGGCLPCTNFRQWCTVNFPPSPQRQQPDVTNAKSILKREACSLEEGGAGALGGARSKSLEQRERDYERVRRRIFSTDNCTQGEPQWPWSSGPVKLLTPETGRNKLLKVQSLESSAPAPQSWRSRGPVSKSHSFSGSAPDHHQPRLLSRQGDLASSSWRLSPSSSGYKTLSLRSTDSVTPSPTVCYAGGASPEPAPGVAEGVVWAVTDLAAVPPGAIVIHPQTGRPLTNPDGSIYHFDPANPPVLYDPNVYKQDESKADNSEKKRGRLEKQHSFMDNECECQPTEECRSTCCSECRRHDGYQHKTTSDKETNTKPMTPTKNRYETVQNHRDDGGELKPKYEEAPLAAHAPHAQHAAHAPEQLYEPAPPAHDPRRNYDTAKEPTNNQRSNNDVNNRQAKPTNQASPEVPVYAQQYQQTYAIEEISTPPHPNPYLQQELSNMPGVMAQAKVAPMHVPDPNMRPMSLTNMVYPTPIPPGFPYVGHRMDAPIQQAMYQQAIQQEEQKQLAASPHANESTFRIDPSYPYAAVDYTAAYGSCVDTSALQHQHRSYSVPYNQVEVQPTVLPPTYPVGNVLLPQPHLQPYPYQDAVQWAGVSGVGGVAGAAAPKIMVPDLYPLLQYPQPFQYNFMYPQMVPQPYPICPPMYPSVEKQPDLGRRNSITRKQNSIPNSCRNTPLHTPPDERKVPYDHRRDNDISNKIQQIKEQMAQLNTKDKDKDRKRDDWKRRNSGNGILGSYPSNNYGGRVMGRPTNDESQLSNEARVIVNSIRNMQAKNTYQGDVRREFRRARPERTDRPPRAHHAPLIRAPCPALLRQMSPGTWCRRSPGPVHPVLNHPRRPHPDARNGARR
ncbi:uncharacterized protein LOC115456448 isoform X2 [Manduca sexta]|uniref:uncharacterized protein LOC115456448 isoform X2 n=1 Tax=Manduca sexta TaxID=7130 RepID=UPI0018901F83|nr:uncharacterized protein LOC115456448 isoform X2 [Manduca sexta]